LLFDLIVSLRARGLTVMIVEQNVHHVLRTADRATCWRTAGLSWKARARHF